MSVGRHTLYNLAGSIAPMFISLVTVPIYLHLIGAPKYGILAIVWMFLGYFGVFDPGLSRATAYTIARLQNANAIERQQVFWTASTINAGLGVLGGIVLYLIGQPVLGHLLKMPADLRGSVMASLPWLAAAVPVATLVGVFSGTLEGLQKFALINTVSFIGTLAFQLIPLSIAFFYTRNLTVIIAATVLVRLATAAVIFGFASFHSRSGWPRVASLSVARQLFSYGSWISVSNLIVPFLATLDKFIIGSYLGVTDVAIYTIPDNLTRRISVVPGALSRSGL
jgi:O-antigen/teichoic acid export membrane protein